jgi:CubicO group peptidase (beta-lactamase class C family)
MQRHDPTRRAVLGAAAAVLALPARAAPPPDLDAAARRAAALDQLHALVVARDGAVVLAEAFRGPSVETPVNVKSVSKTLVAALAGAAIDRGVLDGVDAPVTAHLTPPPGADPRVAQITVEDLLTMRAGLERTSGPNYGAWVASRNWVADALGRPFVDEPGGAFLYSTGSYHLLGAVLARASGRSLHALTRDWLGAPLGIETPPWTRDPQGFFMGGNNMALSPMGLLRFGEMARLGGVWQGRRVLSTEWLAASWTPRTRSPFSGHDYGYGWFIAEIRGRRVFYARGYGGQMVYVIPEAATTVAITSDPNRPARSGGYVGDLHALVAETLIPDTPDA